MLVSHESLLVFGASLLLQTLTSFAFLFVYASSRLVVGFVIGPNFTVQTVLRFVTILSPICFFAIGAIVKKGGDDTWRLVVYIVLNCIIAFTLGTKKVLISPVNLSLWGVNNWDISRKDVGQSLRWSLYWTRYHLVWFIKEWRHLY